NSSLIAENFVRKLLKKEYDQKIFSVTRGEKICRMTIKKPFLAVETLSSHRSLHKNNDPIEGHCTTAYPSKYRFTTPHPQMPQTRFNFDRVKIKICRQ